MSGIEDHEFARSTIFFGYGAHLESVERLFRFLQNTASRNVFLAEGQFLTQVFFWLKVSS